MIDFLKNIFLSKNKKLFKSGIGSLVLRITYTVSKILLVVCLARILGPHEFGIYSYAIAIIMILIIPANAGLPTLLTREIAKYQTKNEWGLLKGIVVRSNQAVTIISIFLILVGIFLGHIYSDNYSEIQIQTFYWSLSLVPFLALTSLQGGALRGLQKIVWGLLPEQAIIPGCFLASVLFIYLFDLFTLDPSSVIFLQVLSAILALLYSINKLKKSLPEQVNNSNSKFRHKKWLNSILPLSFLAGIGVINTQADTIILGIFESAEVVGQYKIAVQGAGLLTFSLAVVNSVIAPRISQLFTKNQIERLQSLIIKTNQLALIPALLVFVIYLFLGNIILSYVFGTGYLPSFLPLIILSIGQLVSTFFGSVGIILNMTGYERDTAFGVGLSALLNIILNFLFVPLWGIKGAALATMITTVFWNTLLCYKLYKRIGILSLPFLFKK